MSVVQLLVFMLLFCGGISEDEEDYGPDPVPVDQWIDPDNMVELSSTVDKIRPNAASGKLAADLTSDLKADLQACSQRLNSANQQLKMQQTLTCDVPHLKKFIHSLLDSATDLNPRICMELQSNEREALRRFLNDKGNVHDASDILIKSLLVGNQSSRLEAINEFFLTYANKPNIIALVMVSLVIATLIIFELTTRMTAWRQFVYLMVICFMLSIPWEWYRLYKLAFASKQVEMMKKLPKECQPDHELGPLESITIWWRGSFQFADNPCAKYQEALLVDPFWEVAPSRAVAVTVTRFFIQPLEYIAEAFGKSFRALFKEVPIQWQPFIFLAGLILLILLILLLSGIQVKLPFLQIGVGRGPNSNAAINLQQLENKMQELTGMIEQLNVQNPPAVRHVEEVDNIENRLQELTAIVQEINHHHNEHLAIMNADQEANRNPVGRQIEALAQAMNERDDRQEERLAEIKGELQQLKPARAEPVEHHEWELVPPRREATPLRRDVGSPLAEGEERPRFFPPVQDSEIPSSPIEQNPATKGKLRSEAADITSDVKTKLLECARLLDKTNKLLKTCNPPHLKKIVNSVVDSGKVSPKEREILNKFLQKGENADDASEILIELIKNEPPFRMESADLNMDAIAVITICVVIVSVVIFELKTEVGAKRQLGFLVGCFMLIYFALFLLSVPWEWYRLKRHAVANKQSEMMKKLPKHCQPDQQFSVWESLTEWWRDNFQFSEDKCAKYHKALLVDATWEVAPIRGVAAAFTSFITEPLEPIAETLGKSFRAFFKEIPSAWQPPLCLTGLILLILIISFLCGVSAECSLFRFSIGSNQKKGVQNESGDIGNVLGKLTEVSKKIHSIDLISDSPSRIDPGEISVGKEVAPVPTHK